MHTRAAILGLVSLLILSTMFLSVNGNAKADLSESDQEKSRETRHGQMPPDFDKDVDRVVAELDKIENDTLRRIERGPIDRQGQMRMLGKLLLSDKHLSVNQNEACSFSTRPRRDLPAPFSP